MAQPNRVADAGPAIAAGPVADAGPAIAALRAAGAHRFDPARFGFIEALARRAAGHQGALRRLLDHKLASALAAYSQRQVLALAEAGGLAERLAQAWPDAAGAVQRLYADGDLNGLHRLAAGLAGAERSGPLAGLVQQINQHGSAPAQAHAGGVAPAHTGELNALRYFRTSWSQLRVDQQLTQSLAKTPDNAGPLNSQRLVLQALGLLRQEAPDYLRRLMSSVDTLLWLDQAAVGATAPPSSPARAGRDKRRKASRSKGGPGV